MANQAVHGDLELLPLEGAKGAVWAFFGFQSKDGVFVEKDKRKRDTVYCKLIFSVDKVLWKYSKSSFSFTEQTSHRIIQPLLNHQMKLVTTMEKICQVMESAQA